jgi:hypothetical protein
MLRFAIEFYAAAVAADKAIGSSPGYEVTAPTPVNYLMGHAIELGLKAYLLHTGTSLGNIHKIGHRLCLAYSNARKAGLDEYWCLSKRGSRRRGPTARRHRDAAR